MNRTLLWLTVVAVAVMFGVGDAMADVTLISKPRAGNCKVLTPTTTDHDYYIYGGGRDIKILVEPDTAGAGSGYIATLSTCSGKEYSANSCELYKWDATDDGTDNESTLDGDSYTQRGIRIPNVAGGVLIDSTTAAGGGETPVVVVCFVGF